VASSAVVRHAGSVALYAMLLLQDLQMIDRSRSLGRRCDWTIRSARCDSRALVR
jgi:hypothetical protein